MRAHLRSNLPRLTACGLDITTGMLIHDPETGRSYYEGSGRSDWDLEPVCKRCEKSGFKVKPADPSAR